MRAFEDVLGELPTVLGDVPDTTPEAINYIAQATGTDPLDVATAISYETAGTFDPWKAGPTTKWGQHRGWIQWGEPQAKEYGVGPETPVGDQAVAISKYLRDRGVRPGMGLLDIYSAINAGSVGRNDASDRPGYTVASHVAGMDDHRRRAAGVLGGEYEVAGESSRTPNVTERAKTPQAPSEPIQPGVAEEPDFDQTLDDLPRLFEARQEAPNMPKATAYQLGVPQLRTSFIRNRA